MEQIVGIGQGLGRGVSAAPGEFTFAGKYRLIHAVGAPEGSKLDADIFILEAGAEVDDVVNIIRMVSGYLQAAYSYSPADAQVLARFVVYYNAVFRGNMHVPRRRLQDHRHGQRHRGQRGNRHEVHRLAGKDTDAHPALRRARRRAA